MPVELFKSEQHRCIMFTDLVADEHEAVQANQFLIVDDGEGVILDPGGNMTYNELSVTMRQYMAPHKLDYILASHADPDIIASLDRWMTSSQAKLVISSLWARFAPHFCKIGKTEDRIVSVPDEGGRLRFGRCELLILPAHFMHSEGNFHFYDPTSKILFTGDLGVSLLSGAQAAQALTTLSPLPPGMERFHRRYMVSNKILRLWVRMVRDLDISMIAPQHGAPLVGAAIPELLEWLEQLACGIDLVGSTQYQLPKNRLL
ncbi:FprA family A-type flavoprotein [Curvibacter sp. CHRR-16]|uniref:MBL fold metallo-hydrolase n=1 Tax=Curvibacter sp. CHRR-16 TaxID=2835872 RepID=UPI001BD983C1|nr:MBL fold metallo-hydrolase [Curvibacter sp. CHRR-16]MBT0569447.1 FprA family A-type flavoprotein [Curvibacter sp. CHRR-16]